MADASESSRPYADSPISTPDQWARWNRSVGHGEYAVDSTGVFNPPDLQVTGNGSSSVTIAAGEASINGFTYGNSTSITRAVPSNSSSATARTDTVVLESNQLTKQSTVRYIAGGSSAPTLTRVINGTWQMPLANILILAGQSTVGATAVTDRRQFVAPNGIVQNTGSISPSSAKLGQTMYRPDGLYIYNASGVWEHIYPQQPLTWVAVTAFGTNYRNYSSGVGGDGYNNAAYAKDPAGIVYLEGLVEAEPGTAGAGSTIFTLPAGYRPRGSHIINVMSRNRNGGQSSLVEQAQRVDIQTDGKVVAMDGLYNAGWISLSNIQFRAA